MPYCKRCRKTKPDSEFIGENGKEYKQCNYCRNQKKCIHGKTKGDCKLCGGTCPHGKRKAICRICNSKAYCEHNRLKTSCKDCGNDKSCIHGNQKHHCKECGTFYCEHKKDKYKCRVCNSKAYCIHNRLIQRCKICGNGKAFCKHGKKKDICVECSGTQICPHNKRKSRCIDCNGRELCPCGKYLYSCIKHKGKGVCDHEKLKSYCNICTPENFCLNCKFIVVASNDCKYKPYCVRCFCILNPESDVSIKYKLKETYVIDELKRTFTDYKFSFNRRIEGGCSKRRPDMYLDCKTHNLVIEIDENQHANYECENKRLMELFQDGGSIPLVIIRFNPDSYVDFNEEKHVSPFSYTKRGMLKVNEQEYDRRFKTFVYHIKNHIENIPKKEITEIKLFYSHVND